jgi:hypothetical protein
VITSRVLVRAFPRRWRERYGAELLELLAEMPERRGQGFDILRAGLVERGRDLRGATLRAQRRVLAGRRRRRAVAVSLRVALVASFVVVIGFGGELELRSGHGARTTSAGGGRSAPAGPNGRCPELGTTVRLVLRAGPSSRAPVRLVLTVGARSETVGACALSRQLVGRPPGTT